MNTLTQHPDNPADPQATPYFLRRLAFSRAFDEAKQWYASGRPPGPPAA